MSGIIQRVPWRVQPPAGVSVAQGFPLRPEFVFVGSNPTVDVATKRPWTIATTVNRVVRPDGRAIDFAATAAAVSRTGVTTVAQTAVTFVAICTRTANNPFAVLMGMSGTSTSFNISTDGSGLSFAITKGGVVQLTLQNIPLDVPHIIVASHNQVSGEYYFLARPFSGVDVLRTTQNNTAASSASNGTATLNTNGGANTFAGTVSLACGFFGFLPESIGRVVLANPYGTIFAPQSRRLWFSADTGGGIALTGNAATASAGTPVAALSLALSGNAATASSGSVAVGGTTQALTGNAAASATGTPTAALSLALAGNAATSARGTPVAALSLALAGNAATTAAGTPTAALSLALTGNAATASPGTVSLPGGVALTGNAATSAQGTVAPGITVALTGNAATASVGSVSPAISLALSGLAGTSSAGIVVPGLSRALSGNAATSAVGAVGVAGGTLTVALTGVGVTASAGSLGAGPVVLGSRTGREAMRSNTQAGARTNTQAGARTNSQTATR